MILCDVKEPRVVEAPVNALYQYRVYVGSHKIEQSAHNSYWYIWKHLVMSEPGESGTILESELLCVEIFGYTPELRTSSFQRGTDLPYINGCSTKQLIPPVRAGDPTFQLLHMPPHTKEQMHHIHSTTRVVYVHSGWGNAILGTTEYSVAHRLDPGNVLILDKMEPHHFETQDSHLTVLPLHVFSSTGTNEFNHPMFNGTHKA